MVQGPGRRCGRFSRSGNANARVWCVPEGLLCMLYMRLLVVVFFVLLLLLLSILSFPARAKLALCC